MCQCRACAVGEALNRGLPLLAVRSLLSHSLSPFSPSSSVRLETAINTNSELQLSSDILAHLKPRFPPRWYFFSLPCPFEMHIHAKMHTRCLNLRGGRYQSRPLSPPALSQHLKVVGGWRFGSCSQSFFFVCGFVCVFSSVTDCQSIFCIFRHYWRVAEKFC